MGLVHGNADECDIGLVCQAVFQGVKALGVLQLFLAEERLTVGRAVGFDSHSLFWYPDVEPEIISSFGIQKHRMVKKDFTVREGGTIEGGNLLGRTGLRLATQRNTSGATFDFFSSMVTEYITKCLLSPPIGSIAWRADYGSATLWAYFRRWQSIIRAGKCLPLFAALPCDYILALLATEPLSQIKISLTGWQQFLAASLAVLRDMGYQRIRFCLFLLVLLPGRVLPVITTKPLSGVNEAVMVGREFLAAPFTVLASLGPNERLLALPAALAGSPILARIISEASVRVKESFGVRHKFLVASLTVLNHIHLYKLKTPVGWRLVLK